MSQTKTTTNKPPPKYKLTYFNFRWLAEPIRMLLHYAGEELEYVPIQIADWNDEFKKQFRFSKLPVLEETLDDGTTLTLSQSFTILRYLGKKLGLGGISQEEEDPILLEARMEEYADCCKDILKEMTDIHHASTPEKKQEIRKNLLNVTLPRYFQPINETYRIKLIVNEEEQAAVVVVATNNKDSSSSSSSFVPILGSTISWLDFLFAHYTELLQIFLNYGEHFSGQPVDDVLENYESIKRHQVGVYGLPRVSEWVKGRAPFPF